MISNEELAVDILQDFTFGAFTGLMWLLTNELYHAISGLAYVKKVRVGSLSHSISAKPASIHTFCL